MAENAEFSFSKYLPESNPVRSFKRDELLINLWLETLGPDQEKKVLRLLDEANREWLKSSGYRSG